MINYELTERGNFTEQDFGEKINEALLSVSKNLKQQKLSFKKVRHTYNQGYTINNEEFCGTYITIQISNKERNLGDVNCFLDNKKKFVEISSSATSIHQTQKENFN
jgi:transcription elongation factor